jgi:GWxTD domain-containing protein
MRRSVALACCVVAPLIGAAPVRAQQVPASRMLPESASRADSMLALARLDSLTRAHPEDADTWHARGLLAWQLSQGKRAVGARMDREQLRLGQTADSSLLQAVTLAPSTVRYLVDFATYRSQGSPFVRGGAARYARRAFDAALAAGDSLALAQMADALGMLAFREYQSMFGRRMALGSGPGASIADIQNLSAGGGGVSLNADLVREAIDARSTLVGGSPPPGVEAFDEALGYFETATRAAPSLPLPWRHRFAALADRRRWEELAVIAGERTTRAPWDADAWLALGLARHRGGQPEAMAAFDSAFAQMTGQTRAHLDHVERIMRPKAVRALDAQTPEERARTLRFAWAAVDPLWSVPGNEVRTEYLARVAFAQLRFTDDEKGTHGVDTFPGDLHVRYGFPKVTANWSCAGSQGEPDSPDVANQVCWLWWFAPRVQFIVHYQPVFNRFRAGFDDVAINEDIQAQAPAHWADVPGVPSLDSIPLRVARFLPDSVRPSIFVSGVVPLERLTVAGLRSAPPIARLWLIADGAPAVAQDTAQISGSGLTRWALRAPAGELYARAEATGLGGGAARGTVFAPALSVGAALALSDVVVATRVEAATPVARWYELDIMPAPDTIARASGVALAWEIYHLGARGGNAQYTVRIVLEKAQKSLAGRIVAQIGGLVGAQRGDDRVTLAFDRTGPARPVTVEHIALSLREAPAGGYSLTVEITDKVSGATAMRRTMVRLGN